jgi:hypothetical protein
MPSKSAITYFETPGPANTAAVIQIALDRYQKGGIDRVMVASTYGDTALQAARAFEEFGASLLVFGEVLEEGQSPAQEACRQLEAAGHKVIWGVHFNAMSTFTGENSARLVSEAYYRISEGFKVACEIVMIAASQGYLRKGQKVLAMGGTHRGTDTAIVASAAPITHFKDFEVHEILCKPYRRIKE